MRDGELKLLEAQKHQLEEKVRANEVLQAKRAAELAPFKAEMARLQQKQTEMEKTRLEEEQKVDAAEARWINLQSKRDALKESVAKAKADLAAKERKVVRNPAAVREEMARLSTRMSELEAEASEMAGKKEMEGKKTEQLMATEAALPIYKKMADTQTELLSQLRILDAEAEAGRGKVLFSTIISSHPKISSLCV